VKTLTCESADESDELLAAADLLELTYTVTKRKVRVSPVLGHAFAAWRWEIVLAEVEQAEGAVSQA